MYFDGSFHSVIWTFFRNNYLKTPFSGRCFLRTTDGKKGAAEVELADPESRWDRDEIFLSGFWRCDWIALVKGVIAPDVPSWACGRASAELGFPARANSDANAVYDQRCYRFGNAANGAEGVISTPRRSGCGGVAGRLAWAACKSAAGSRAKGSSGSHAGT